MRLLILGSNFGKLHLRAAMKSNKFSKISIASPNINQKKILNSINKYSNFKKALNSERYEMISIAVTPTEQHKILNFILKKKLFTNFILLEKPILDKSILLLKRFPRKTFFLTNFIYSFDKKWIFFKKKIKNISDIISFDYTWYFKQHYFINRIKTWKITPQKGGGLINYYLPHAVFNILNNFNDAKFLKINKKKYQRKNLIYLDIIFLLKNKHCHLKISNNSNKNLHKFSVITTKTEYSLINNSANWLSNFKFLKKDNEIYNSRFVNQKSKESRLATLISIYSNLQKYYSKGNTLLNKKLTYNTFKIIKNINKKIL